MGRDGLPAQRRKTRDWREDPMKPGSRRYCLRTQRTNGTTCAWFLSDSAVLWVSRRSLFESTAWICRWQARCMRSVALPPLQAGTRWWRSVLPRTMGMRQIGQLPVVLSIARDWAGDEGMARPL